MTPMAIAGLVLAGLATAAGGVTAGLVVTTSGPFANGGNEAAPSATASVAPSAVPSVSAKPSSTPVAKLPPDTVIGPTDQFDFDSLPDIDESGWKTTVGPTGTLTVKAPPDWVVSAEPSSDAAGHVTGDDISVYKPTSQQLDVGNAPPGWVKVDLGVSSRPVDATNGGETPLRTADLHRSVAGLVVSLEATQFGQSPQFPNIHGGIALTSALRGASGLYLTGGAHVWLPATAGDISTARQIMESVVLK
jgi:hypothetical protein